MKYLGKYNHIKIYYKGKTNGYPCWFEAYKTNGNFNPNGFIKNNFSSMAVPYNKMFNAVLVRRKMFRTYYKEINRIEGNMESLDEFKEVIDTILNEEDTL